MVILPVQNPDFEHLVLFNFNTTYIHMKTIKHIVLMVMLACYPIIKTTAQSEFVRFCETYTQQKVFSKLDPEDKFFKLIQVKHTDPGSSRLGKCPEASMDQLWDYVQSDSFRDKVQADLILAPGNEAKEKMIPVYAIKKSASDQVFPMPDDLKEVSVSKDENKENYSLLITFSEAGAEKWALITRMNKGRDIAMVFQGKVIAAPRVTEEIKHGKCMISGKFTKSEINSLKAILEN